MKAQLARGSDISTGSIKQRIRAVIPLLVPLFVSAFKRAEDLAVAMEVRGYRGGEGQNEVPAIELALARYDDQWCCPVVLVVILLLFRG